MGLRRLLIKEETRTSFLVSDVEGYEDTRYYARFQVHNVRNHHVVTENSFGTMLDCLKVLDVLNEEKEAIELAYLSARKYAEGLSLTDKSYEDRTHFRGISLKGK